MEIEKLNEFLSNFPWYYRRIIWDKPLTNWDKNKTLEEVIQLNKEKPSKLYMSPNGNFKETNVIWEKTNFTAIGTTDVFNAFVLDFNKVNKKQKIEDFKKEKIDYINKHCLFKRRYVVTTNNWFNVYFVLDSANKKIAWEKYWKELFDITEFLAKTLWADSTRKVVGPWWLFRMPWSLQWNLVDKSEITITNFQDCFVDIDEIDKMFYYINQIEKRDKDIQYLIKWKNGNRYFEFNKTNISGVREDLKAWWYDVGKNSASKKNVIIWTIWEDIFENPFGNPLEFVYCCEWWYPTKVKTCLSKIFWIEEITAQNKEAFMESEIEWNWFVVYFYENMVQLKVFNLSPKWEAREQTTVLFRNSIKILWRWVSRAWKMWAEVDQEYTVYVMEIDWKETIIETITDKKTFNKKYRSTFFYWTDNDLWMFFNALSNCETIEDINIYEKNWYYDDVCILGNTAVSWKLWDDRIILGDKWFNLVDWIQISVKEYLSMFRDCYQDEFSIPMFLCALTLWWMNLWDALEVNPAVLLSWLTWCWKSTISNLLKKMLWYAQNARTMALPGISAQPLKQSASDNSILFLEELTNRVSAQTEELLRNIVNRDKGARWMMDDNLWRTFSSPLRVNGERTFKEESLNNRFCTFIMSQRFRKDSANKILQDLEKYTCYEDIYTTYITYKDSLKESLYQYKNYLIDNWISSRSADVWSYMFVVNNIFWFWFEDEKLLWYVKFHLTNSGLSKDSKKENYNINLQKYLTASIITNKMSLNVSSVMDTTPLGEMEFLDFSILFLDKEIYQEQRWSLHSAIWSVNELLGKNVFDIDEWWINVRMRNYRNSQGKFVNTTDQFIADFFWAIVNQLPSRVYANNKTFGLMDRI